MGTKGFIATANFNEENVSWVGEASTIEAALEDLQQSGEFNDYCASNDIPDETKVEVGVFKAIYKGEPEWDSEMFNDDWDWALNARVATKFITYYE